MILFIIIATVVSQNYSVLVFVEFHTIIARYVAKWVNARMRLCETKHQWGKGGGYRTILMSCILQKYRAIWGVAAIVSQHCAYGATKHGKTRQ